MQSNRSDVSKKSVHDTNGVLIKRSKAKKEEHIGDCQKPLINKSQKISLEENHTPFVRRGVATASSTILSSRASIEGMRPSSSPTAT